ncbi:MAG: zf-HC2 domain-containing protein [Vicinamibacterales bacterium]
MCDNELLVGYLYDDMAPGERRIMDAHLVTCEDCRTELTALRGTRTTLTAWAPPTPDLAFPFVRPAPAPVQRVRAWTVSPAWGLAAAAVLVLSVATAVANVEVKYGPEGLSVRTGAARAVAAPAAVPASPIQTVTAPGDAELRRQLVAMGERLRALEATGDAHAVPASMHVAAPPSGDLRVVRQLIADSESRQEQVLARRISQVLRDVEGARRVDFDRTQRALAEIQSVADTTMIRQRETENVLRVVHSVSK